MLRMRLQRRGRKNYATYRVVIADQRAPIKGKFVADLGPYNPHTKEFKVDKEAVQEWLSKGVQPTATVHNLLVENKYLKAEKVTSWKPKVRKADAETDDKKNTSPQPSPSRQTGGQAPGEGDDGEAKDEPMEEVKAEKKDEPEDKKGDLEDKKEPEAK